MGGIFSKGCHFSSQFSNCSSVIKNDDAGAQVGNAYLAYMVVTPLYANQASSSKKRDFIPISYLNDLSILSNSEY